MNTGSGDHKRNHPANTAELGRVDKARLGDSPDAGKYDSKLIFKLEIGLVRGLLSGDEWAFFEPRDHRHTLDAIFWIARRGAPWRDLPEELGNWNWCHRQYRRWTACGLWDLMLEALADGGGNDAVQMVDSTVIRAHHCAAGAKGGLKTRLLAARAVAFITEPASGARCSQLLHLL